ncbi:DUF4296 domain-containing protein [Flavobacterium sp. TP390]|uniref:DUF4296 domain-containing protein n=1 Tax=Flavobacterium profundi TaxID=1774945 RepID=A0A6I4IT85_9FLAO|nr:DUF4296 domain-containing protein [Flavobacterium profundi]MVO10080.1 DUF4296 domain-containing protein [Flavobacterium profundi]
MKRIVVLAFLVLFSCAENPVPKPDRLLSEETMVDILYDTALLQASEAYLPNKLTENKIRIKNYIYTKYDLDSTTYYQNQRYYAADFKKYKRMYKKVSDRLQQRKTELDTLIAQENRNVPEKSTDKKREFNKPSIKELDSLSSQ